MRQYKKELWAELETLAASVTAATITAGNSAVDLTLKDMSQVAALFGWGEGEDIEMAFRLIRASRAKKYCRLS